MASTTCGYCGRLTHMTILDGRSTSKTLYLQGAEFHRWIIDAAFYCDACGRLSVATGLVEHHPGNDPRQLDVELDASQSVRWEPKAVDRVEFPDVPERIAPIAAEAHACASIGARTAAIIVARAVLEASAKHLGTDGNNLSAYINALGDSGLLLPAIVEAAHEIRFFGNDMAHGDFAEDVSDEDVDEVLGIMDDVLDALFTQPARTRRRADARTKRREANI